MRTLKSVVAIAILFGPTSSCLAQNCQALLKSFLDPDPRLSSIYVSMVTLNSNDVASYAETRLYYLPEKKVPHGRTIPGRYLTLEPGSQGVDQPKFDFGKSVQVFSDRRPQGPAVEGTFVGLPNHLHQKFDERRADDLAMELTDTQPVLVTLTLRSWGNKKVTFTPACEAGGFMYGSTSDVKYILRISKWPPPVHP